MIVFTGVAGSGKSYQGKRLADEYGLPWLSTGEFLRMLIHGDERKDMLAGKLLPDEDMIRLIQKVFGFIDIEKECVLDGFPRTMSQADWLLTQDRYDQLTVSAVVNLEIDEKIVKERLLERARKDDNESAIQERFLEYRSTIQPILQLFSDSGHIVVTIDASKSKEDVFQDIVSELLKKGVL